MEASCTGAPSSSQSLLDKNPSTECGILSYELLVREALNITDYGQCPYLPEINKSLLLKKPHSRVCIKYHLGLGLKHSPCWVASWVLSNLLWKNIKNSS